MGPRCEMDVPCSVFNCLPLAARLGSCFCSSPRAKPSGKQLCLLVGSLVARRSRFPLTSRHFLRDEFRRRWFRLHSPKRRRIGIQERPRQEKRLFRYLESGLIGSARPDRAWPRVVHRRRGAGRGVSRLGAAAGGDALSLRGAFVRPWNRLPGAALPPAMGPHAGRFSRPDALVVFDAIGARCWFDVAAGASE